MKNPTKIQAFTLYSPLEGFKGSIERPLFPHWTSAVPNAQVAKVRKLLSKVLLVQQSRSS